MKRSSPKRRPETLNEIVAEATRTNALRRPYAPALEAPLISWQAVVSRMARRSGLTDERAALFAHAFAIEFVAQLAQAGSVYIPKVGMVALGSSVGKGKSRRRPVIVRPIPSLRRELVDAVEYTPVEMSGGKIDVRLDKQDTPENAPWKYTAEKFFRRLADASEYISPKE